MTERDDISDDAALAAEYALNLMDAADRKVFDARLQSDPKLRQLVHSWEADFATLLLDVEEITPPKSAKVAVMRAVDPVPKTKARLWNGLFGALFAASAVFVIAFFNGGFIGDTPFVPVYQATLAGDDGTVVLTATFNADATEMLVEQTLGGPPAERVFELWVIAADASAPRSLGVLRPDGATRIQVSPALVAALPNGTLAISDEPPGGSPTGAPTGQVHATAPVIRL